MARGRPTQRQPAPAVWLFGGGGRFRRAAHAALRENLAAPGDSGKNELSARRELHNVSPSTPCNMLVFKDYYLRASLSS